MDFSKIFGRNQKQPGLSEDKFEELMKAAMKNPNLRPKFCNALLEHELHIKGSGSKPNYFNMTKGVRAVAYSSQVILKKALQEEQDFFKINTRQFLKLLPAGAGFLLNPLSDCSMELASQDVQNLLIGNVSGKTVYEVKYAKENPVSLGQPANYPQKMVDALTEYFEKDPCFERAYLAQIFVKDSGEPPHWIVGVKVNKKISKPFGDIVPKLGEIATATLKKGDFLDLVDIDNGGEIVEYFIKETKPFYDRK